MNCLVIVITVFAVRFTAVKSLHSRSTGATKSGASSSSSLPTVAFPFNSELHYEVELGVVIGKTMTRVSEKDAMGHVAGYFPSVDLTLRDEQEKAKEKGHPWEIAKGFDNSAPISKFWELNTFEDLTSIRFSMLKNGEVVQEGDTANLIFSFTDLICHISKFFKIQQGDLIFTGTPAGVGPVIKGDQLLGRIQGEDAIKCEIR